MTVFRCEILGIVLDNVLGAGVKPHNGVVEGTSSDFVPDHRGLTLVGDPEAGNVAVVVVGPGGGGVKTLLAGLANVFGTFLNPAGLGKDLGELYLVGEEGGTRLVK